MNSTGSGPVKMSKCVSQYLTNQKCGKLTISNTSPIIAAQSVARSAAALKTAFQVDAILAAHWGKELAFIDI
jgi:hypothetical protein